MKRVTVDLSSELPRFLCIVAFAASTLVGCATTGAQPPPPPPLDQQLEAIDKLITGLEADGLFQGSVVISHENEVVFQKGYGEANIQWEQGNGPGTIFRVGSITKVLTAMAILRLAQDGVLDIDKTISDYLDYYRRDTGTIITISQLMSHTSGLDNFTELPEYPDVISRLRISTTEFVTKYCQNDLLFQPGTAYRYSNSGYYVLGAIIEAVTGKTYGENLDELIFKPLQMSDSGYDQNSLILDEPATGYLLEGCDESVAPFIELSVPFSAGGLFTVVGDLAKLDKGVSENTILNAEFTAKMFDRYFEIGSTPPLFSNYGWEELQLPGFPSIYGKSGLVNGFINQMFRTDEYFVAVLSNNQDSNSGSIAGTIIMSFYGVPLNVQTLPRVKIQRAICANGPSSVLTSCQDLTQNFGLSAVGDLSAVGQNFLGVDLNTAITLEDINTAIAVFQLNAQCFPAEPLVYQDLERAFTAKADHLPKSLCCSTCCQPPPPSPPPTGGGDSP